MSFFLLICVFCEQSVMNDSWINNGHEDDKLRPYQEPPNLIDDRRLGKYYSTFVSQLIIMIQ